MLLNIDPVLYAKGKHAVGTCAYCKVGIKERHLDFNLVVSWMCYCFHRIASLFDSTSVIISKLKSELVTSRKIIYTSLAHCTIPANKLKIKNGENLYLFCQLDSFSIPNGFLGRVVVIMKLNNKSEFWYCIQKCGPILSKWPRHNITKLLISKKTHSAYKIYEWVLI